MIRNKSEVQITSKRSQRVLEKAFANVDILLAIIEFIEDKDLLTFLLIKKASYSLLKKSKLIEIRVLNYKLKNAERTLEQLQIDVQVLRRSKKKKEQNEINKAIPSYTSFPSLSELTSAELINRSFINNIILHSKFYRNFELKKNNAKLEDTFYEEPIQFPEKFDLNDSTSTHRDDMIKFWRYLGPVNYISESLDKGYSDIVAKASFQYEVKKCEVKSVLDTCKDLIEGVERAQDKTTEVIKSGFKYFCPVTLARSLYRPAEFISGYFTNQ